MTETVVVLGAGYAGTTAVQRLERELDDVNVIWVSRDEYHLILHEVHRVVSDPSVEDDITVPVAELTGPSTEFVQAEVTDVDTEDRRVELDGGDDRSYDYLLVALGSQTAYYGIPGLAENAHTLKSLADSHQVHEDVVAAANEASRNDPAQIAVGGAGLSGIQLAGEIAELRDEHNYPIDITLIEAMEEIMPGQDPTLQQAVRRRVESRNIDILTDDPIVEAGEREIEFDEGDPLEYDVFVWTGGITGQDALDDVDLENNHNRIETDATFRTSDERVFAIGDSALIDQNGEVAPPTAQAAWQAGDHAGKNVARRIRGLPLETWTYSDKGTVLSIGEDAVAHDLFVLPGVTFGSLPARFMKKAVAARWLTDIHSLRRAVSAWGSL